MSKPSQEKVELRNLLKEVYRTLLHCPKCGVKAEWHAHNSSDDPYEYVFHCECPKCGLKWEFIGKTSLFDDLYMPYFISRLPLDEVLDELYFQRREG